MNLEVFALGFKMDFFIIADPHTYLAFALAGVPGGQAETAEQARRLFQEARESPGIGLILITERLAEGIREEVDALRWEGGGTLVVEIPDLAGPLPREETLLDRVRALMGLPK
ncbi:MAG: V-type ATP synthase subunit F [Syntrophobacterales bacterium]